MQEFKHIFSESAVWHTESVFITPSMEQKTGTGESQVTVTEDKIVNNSWSNNGDLSLRNEYRITPLEGNRFFCRSANAILGVQYGWMDIHKNTVFSKFVFEKSELNGFEVITREGDRCIVAGSLYDGNKLINTWTAVMTKISGETGQVIISAPRVRTIHS